MARPVDDMRTMGPRLTPDDRRRHLLGVARDVVERDGVAALSMEVVAARANVSRALVYTYFDNRAGLLSALWDLVAQIWSVQPMEPVSTTLTHAQARQLFDERLESTTRWYFDQIERSGLLFHRLMAEPSQEVSVERLRKRIHNQNVRWWADLVTSMGIDGDSALVFSTLFNGASEMMWELIARSRVKRNVVEDVFFSTAWVGLEHLLAAQAHDIAPRSDTRARPA
ncbi:MAG: TetR/AcrR family transcriptional regulator [Ilumatobacteraceae bacterium]